MRKPTIILPYSGPDPSGLVEDIFLYLRPESNGVQVESILMKVLRNKAEYRENAELVYLANLPGDFIIQNHVIEDHYSVNYRFACRGKSLFTPFMKERFEAHFQENFDQAIILGAFEALEYLGMNAEELFSIWVPPQEMIQINDQSIKKYKNI